MNILIVAAYTPEEKTNMHCEAAELLTCDMLDKVHHQAHLQLIPFRPNTTRQQHIQSAMKYCQAMLAERAG